MRLLRLACLPFLLSPVLASAASVAAAVPLVQHRAVYDLRLSEASESSGITGISGRMVYEIRGSACEGYTVRFRYVTQSSTRDASQITDQQTTTFEDADGKSFSFATKSYTDQALDKELRGNASRLETVMQLFLDYVSSATPALQAIGFADIAQSVAGRLSEACGGRAKVDVACPTEGVAMVDPARLGRAFDLLASWVQIRPGGDASQNIVITAAAAPRWSSCRPDRPPSGP